MSRNVPLYGEVPFTKKHASTESFGHKLKVITTLSNNSVFRIQCSNSVAIQLAKLFKFELVKYKNCTVFQINFYVLSL